MVTKMAWITHFFPITALLAVSWIMRTYGNLLTAPKNTVAKLGDRVEFKCSTNETRPDTSDFNLDASNDSIPLDWKLFFVNSTKFENIYLSGYINRNFTSKYAIDSTKIRGTYNLIMNSVDLTFAGTYKCSELQFPEEQNPSASAELIVLASDPVCSSNASKVIAEGDYVRMSCTVNYSGNWIPAMEWTRNAGQTDDAVIIDTKTSNTVSSSLTAQLNSSDNGVTFTCKTHIKPLNSPNRTLGSGEALKTIVPYYQYLWNYTTTVSPDSGTTDTPGPDNGLVVIIVFSVGAMILFIAVATIICKLCKRGKAKPDVVPQVEQNNFDVSNRLQPQNDSPLYAEVQRSSNGFEVMENHLMPVYATVKKERIAGDLNKQTVTNNYQQNESIPVYAEVKKMEKEKKILGPSGQIMMPTNTKPKQNYAGADGTQYMELDSLTELTSNGIPTKRPLMFNLVETYATIDHTMVAPPPPPSLPRRHLH